ncbi:MAG: hypothetical protein Q4B52_01570 [Tissierellia bacterium]|nr:hypothetical protein [Tissierellia bacterium]
MPVLDKRVGYGGYQKNLLKMGIKKFYADRSCVVTAFTNVFLYLFRWGEDFDVDEFNKYQYEFFNLIKPTIAGVPTAGFLKFKLRKLLKKYKLKSHILVDTFLKKTSLKEKTEFIIEALEKDLPVILFNWQSKNISILKNHAVTITQIEGDKNDPIITVSSWSNKYKVKLRDLNDQFSLYKSMIYFEREDIMKFLKVEIFIPEENEKELIEKLNEKEILKYGDYDSCYSKTSVKGHFRPLENSNPFIGEKNQINEVNEVKIEFRIKRQDKNICDEIIRSVHPYEEPVINYIELI